MRRTIWGGMGCVIGLAAVLTGCGHRADSNPAPGPTMSSAQMEKGIADINNNPRMSPQQKAQMIGMIRDHVKATSK